jgi:pentatricopeptide repeat protein
MESKGCSPPLVVYNTLINGLCKAERFCHAYSFVKEMLKRDWKPDSITYSLLIMALNLWRQALDKGLEPYVTF